MMRGHLSAPRSTKAIPASLVYVLLVSHGVIVVALFAAGLVVLLQAVVLLVLPVVLAVATLRPEWTILIILALPPAVVSPIPPLQLVALLIATLFGFFLQGRLHVGPNIGVYPLVGIVALAMTVTADAPLEAAAAADAMLKEFIYYVLLMLVAFHAIANGRMQIGTFVDVLLLGLVGAALLQPFVGNLSGFESITHHPFRGQFGHLAVMGFGVAYVRLSSTSLDRRHSALDSFLMLAFLCLAAIGFSRAAWMAALSIFAVVCMWTGKKSFWIVSSLLLVLVLTVPVVGERVLPGGSTDIADPQTLARLTTGRSELWKELWERGVDALPFGQGWGYIWSLSSSDIFGLEGQFVVGDNPFIYAHNDFLYLFVELGILGLGLLVGYWLHLFRKIRLLSHSRIESVRSGVRLLVPVIIVMLFAQLFDAAFAVRFVAERFFVVAGLVFGLGHIARQSERSDLVGSRLVGTSRATP